MSKTIEKSMMLTTSNWGPQKTFKLIPVTNDCPYVEAIFDPSAKILAIISRISKESYHMVPKLDDNGDPQGLKMGKRTNGKDFKEQRVLMGTHAEYYVSDKVDIDNIVNGFAINADSFDYAKYFEVEEVAENPLPSSKATTLNVAE